MNMQTLVAIFTCLLLLCSRAWANPVTGPSLVDPEIGTLTLVAQGAHIDRIDGLEFDSHGNLFAALEIAGATGGVVSIDTTPGTNFGEVSRLVTGISRADQLTFAPNGDMYVSSEVSTGSNSDRLFKVNVAYRGAIQTPSPVSTTWESVTTMGTVGQLDNPEGLIALPSGSGFGGDLLVAEDKFGGRVVAVNFDGTTSELAFMNPEVTDGLQRLEGMDFGDFGGAKPQGLYVAETKMNRVLHVDPSGNTSVFGTNHGPSGLAFDGPDNVRFGPDGNVYVTEDAAASRVLRAGPDGTFSVFAHGFNEAAGMAFAPNGDMYIAEQALDRLWRVQFAPASAVPEPSPILLLGVVGLVVGVARFARQARKAK